MTHIAAEPLAQLSRLWCSGSHSTAHPYSGTSFCTADTRVPPHEAVLVSAWVELLLQAVNNYYRKFDYSGLPTSSLLHVALSKVLAI